MRLGIRLGIGIGLRIGKVRVEVIGYGYRVKGYV